MTTNVQTEENPKVEKQLERLFKSNWIEFTKNNKDVIVLFSAALSATLSVLVQLLTYIWYYVYALYFKIAWENIVVKRQDVLYFLLSGFIIFIVIGYLAYNSVKKFYDKKLQKNKLKHSSVVFVFWRFVFWLILLIIAPIVFIASNYLALKYNCPIYASIGLFLFMALEMLSLFALLFNFLGLGLYSCTQEYNGIRDKIREEITKGKIVNIIKTENSSEQKKQSEKTMSRLIFYFCVISLALMIYIALFSIGYAYKKKDFDIVIEQTENIEQGQQSFAVLYQNEKTLYVSKCNILQENSSLVLELDTRIHKVIPLESVTLKRETFSSVKLDGNV